MKQIRKFVASSELFLGFEVYLDINIYDSIDTIINEFYENLLKVLSRYNFEILLEKAKQCKFHIHDFTFDDIYQCDEHDVIYICDNCY